MPSIQSAGKAGPTRWWALFGRLSLRHLREEPLRFLLTVLGIGLGLALVTAIRLSNAAALDSFNDSIDLMAGKANLSLSRPGGPLPESLLKDLMTTRKDGALLPILQGKMARAGQPREFLTVLGVDLLKDLEARDYRLLGRDGRKLTGRDFLGLLPKPDVVFLTQRYGRQNRIQAGDRVAFLANDRSVTLTVGGLLAEEGAGKALDGDLALMDIAAAQKVFGKIGKIDRLEWVVPDEARRQALASQLRKLYPSWKVERPARRGEKVEKMLSAFRANLLALSLVSLLVGAFLIYNSMSIAVLRRVGEIGILRTLGATRRQVMAWILAESLFLSLAGALVGLGLGKVLAVDVLKVISRTIHDLYLSMPLEERLPGLSAVLNWVFPGAGLILAAAVPPALAASRIAPGLSTRKGYAETAFGARVRGMALAGVGAWALAAGLSPLPAVRGLPLFGYAAAFLLLVGCVFLTPLFMASLYGLLQRVLRRSLSAEAFLAFRNLLSGLGRSSVAVGALAMSVALLVSVAVMVGSFRETVVVWLSQTLKADLYIRPAADEGGPLESRLGAGTVEALRAVPGVEDVQGLRTFAFNWGGTDVTLSAMDLAGLSRKGSVVFKTPGDPARLLKSVVGQPAVLVSEPLSLKRGIREGDWITLPGPAGPVSVQVAAVCYDYSSDQGSVVMDRAVYARLFKDDSLNAAALYLKEGFTADQVARDLAGRMPPGTALFIRSTKRLREEALRVFDRTFAITYGMEAIALVVAVLGIFTTLTALILERRPEIVILRYVGARRGQVRRMILWEAGWMGLLGNLLGLGVGMALALLLIKVINVQSFGWTIQWSTPWGFLAGSLGLVFLATLMAGIYPAWVAGRLPVLREVTGE